MSSMEFDSLSDSDMDADYLPDDDDVADDKPPAPSCLPAAEAHAAMQATIQVGAG